MSVIDNLDRVEITEHSSGSDVSPSPTKEFGIYELYTFFEINNDELGKENMDKVEVIHNWAKQFETKISSTIY